MYHRKNKKYTQKSSFTVESTEQSIYNLFYNIRYHSFPEESFKEDLKDTCENLNLSVKDFSFQGCSLLFYSALYENPTTFKYLIENHKEDFKDDILKSIYYVYSNRDANILNIAMQSLECSQEEMCKLLKTISQNCYREENIQVINSNITQWLKNKTLSISDINNFVSDLIVNNNKSYLFTAAKEPNFKEYIIKQIAVHSEEISPYDLVEFYYKIISPNHTYPQSFDHQINDLDLRNFMSYNKSKKTEDEYSTSQLHTTSKNNRSSAQDEEITNKKITETNQPVVTVKKRILQH